MFLFLFILSIILSIVLIEQFNFKTECLVIFSLQEAALDVFQSKCKETLC